MAKTPLDEFVSVTVSADGTGFSLPIGPVRYTEMWTVTLISMQTTGNLETQSEVIVYRGSASPVNQVDYTQKVEGDTSNTNITLRVGEYLLFEWRGCTVGAVGVAHVIGDREIRV